MSRFSEVVSQMPADKHDPRLSRTVSPVGPMLCIIMTLSAEWMTHFNAMVEDEELRNAARGLLLGEVHHRLEFTASLSHRLQSESRQSEKTLDIRCTGPQNWICRSFESWLNLKRIRKLEIASNALQTGS
jgi:hypothetical protein